MKIVLDGTDYDVTEETLQTLQLDLLKFIDAYKNMLDGSIKAVIEMFVIRMLYKLESDMVAKGMLPEFAKQVRPAKGESPIDKFIQVMFMGAKMYANNAEIRLQTDNSEITAISVGVRSEDKGKGGG
jgi:hypothetical protein